MFTKNIEFVVEDQKEYFERNVILIISPQICSKRHALNQVITMKEIFSIR